MHIHNHSWLHRLVVFIFFSFDSRKQNNPINTKKRSEEEEEKRKHWIACVQRLRYREPLIQSFFFACIYIFEAGKKENENKLPLYQIMNSISIILIVFVMFDVNTKRLKHAFEYAWNYVCIPLPLPHISSMRDVNEMRFDASQALLPVAWCSSMLFFNLSIRRRNKKKSSLLHSLPGFRFKGMKEI